MRNNYHLPHTLPEGSSPKFTLAGYPRAALLTCIASNWFGAFMSQRKSKRKIWQRRIGRAKGCVDILRSLHCWRLSKHFIILIVARNTEKIETQSAVKMSTIKMNFVQTFFCCHFVLCEHPCDGGDTTGDSLAAGYQRDTVDCIKPYIERCECMKQNCFANIRRPCSGVHSMRRVLVQFGCVRWRWCKCYRWETLNFIMSNDGHWVCLCVCVCNFPPICGLQLETDVTTIAVPSIHRALHSLRIYDRTMNFT